LTLLPTVFITSSGASGRSYSWKRLSKRFTKKKMDTSEVAVAQWFLKCFTILEAMDSNPANTTFETTKMIQDEAKILILVLSFDTF